MDEQFRTGFDRMLADMPEPPTWEHVSAQRLAPTVKAGRTRGPLVAVAAFVLTVVALSAGLLMVRGGSEPVGSGTVDYVKLSWSQDVEMRCLGLETVDNGGFDSATIEIWGPNGEGLVRVDATAPDGTVERLIVEPGPFGGFPIRAWSSYESALGDDTVFRVSECFEKTPGGSSSFSMANPPIRVDMHFFGVFVALSTERPDGTSRNVAEDLARNSTTRDDEWRGVPVTVFESSGSWVDELGSYEHDREIWFDAVAQRYERTMFFGDSEVLGRVRTTVEVVERDTVAVDTVSFSVVDLTLRMDRSLSTAPDEPVVVTTSIVPTAHPLMADATEINPTDIPTTELYEAIDPQEGDQLFTTPIPTGYSLIVRLRATERPHMFATACSVLVSVELPAGWDGTCLERTIDGTRMLGTVSYADARDE
jgi:hypothetical protein